MILNRKSDKKGWRNKEMTELEKSKEIIQFIAILKKQLRLNCILMKK